MFLMSSGFCAFWFKIVNKDFSLNENEEGKLSLQAVTNAKNIRGEEV